MKISIVIATHNECWDLEATVALAMASDPPPLEIIVIDDLSDDLVKPRLASFPDVRVYRTETQLGSWPARTFGANSVRPDTNVIILLDSHMRMPLNWLEHVKEACTLYPESSFCTVCRGFGTTTKFLGAGARFDCSDLFLTRKWLPRGNVETIDECPCLLGACYIIPRKIWRDLGGVNPNFHGWGVGEEDFSLRSRMSGYEIRRINSLVTPHCFGRKRSGFFMNTWHKAFNTLVTAATVFEDGVFEKLYEPFFRAVFPSKALIRFNEKRSEIDQFREVVQARRIHDDKELSKLCSFNFPTVERQSEIVKG